MDSELINQLLALPGKTIKLSKGEFLFREGDKAEYFYIVTSGRMSIKKFESSGHTFALRLIEKDNVLGEVPLFEDGKRTYVFNAIAREPATVYAIRYDVLEPYVQGDSKLLMTLMHIMTLHMRRQESKYRDLILYGKKGAFYTTLI